MHLAFYLDKSYPFLNRLLIVGRKIANNMCPTVQRKMAVPFVTEGVSFIAKLVNGKYNKMVGVVIKIEVKYCLDFW
ncbi:hypothetical protein BACCIP111883_00629 [Sutcliffiella rhizosphaerae]|uniref:Uncharacterized protein n=1 Tax=Sutcliffiella rhizosphaerae TaxID=2880967 RepID=A0ABM8YIW7_9BACI|nr:hypothetical protein BACCIP111883_00629 [Sutcliffiella rhizosphaerae]